MIAVSGVASQCIVVDGWLSLDAGDGECMMVEKKKENFGVEEGIVGQLN